MSEKNLTKNEIQELNQELIIKNNKLNNLIYNIYNLDEIEKRIIEENI